MDELLKRLAEIRERAAAISTGEIGEAEITELRALKAERIEIEGKVEGLKIAAELESESEAEKVEEVKEEEKVEETETPAETPAEVPAEAPAEEEKVEEVAETPTPEAIAAALGSVKSDTDLGDNAPATGLAIIASSASFGVQSGEALASESWNRIHSMAKGAQAGVKQTFATIARHTNEKAVSARNSAIENSVLMARGSKGSNVPTSLTAAACYCGPNEVDKSIESRGLMGRPIAASIRSTPFAGPFDYVRDMDLGDVSTGVTLWDCTDQNGITSGNPATWKPCVTLDCGDSVTVTPYAIPACGLFSIFQQLSHPELVDDFINKLGIYYDRLAEQALIDKIRADNTLLTYGGTVGMGLLHQLTGAIGHLSSIAGYTRRLGWDNYTLYVPPGMLTALIADEHRRGFSRGANAADILAQISALGVSSIVEMLDLDTAAEPGLLTAAGTFIDPGNTVALNICNLPATWTVHLVPTDAYVRGESTLVEAGFERDTDLVRQNMVQYFFEGHEFIEKRTPDVPGWTIELSGAATGGSSALVTPEAC